MRYKACFDCEVLFEVDPTEEGAARCPTCDGDLEDYEPQAEELDASFDEPEPTTAMAADPSIVATVAFEGLSDAVRDALSQQQARADEDEDGLAKTRMAMSPGAQDKTQMLDVLEEELTAPVPQPPAERPKRRRYGVRADSDAKRQTRVAEVGDEDPTHDRGPAPPRPAAPRPAAARPARPRPKPAPRPSPRATPPPVLDRATMGAMPMRKTGPKPVVYVIAAGAVLAFGAGVGLWLTSGSEGDGGEAKPDAAVAAGPSWGERLKAQLEASQVMLPVMRDVESLSERLYLAGGPEGLVSSDGPIVGLASTSIPESSVESDGRAEWSKPLRVALEARAQRGPIALALDGTVLTKNLMRLANAARLAGFTQLGLVVGRQETPGRMGVLPFTQRVAKDPMPEGGQVRLRIGQLGFRVVAEGPGKPGRAQAKTIERNADTGALSLSRLGAHLDVLHEQFPEVQVCLIHPIGEMSLDKLGSVIGVVRSGERGPRLPKVHLSF